MSEQDKDQDKLVDHPARRGAERLGSADCAVSPARGHFGSHSAFWAWSAGRSRWHRLPGSLLGRWLDHRWATGPQFTLLSLLVGVAVGCYAAWTSLSRRNGSAGHHR